MASDLNTSDVSRSSGNWLSRMFRNPQIAAAIIGGIVAGIFGIVRPYPHRHSMAKVMGSGEMRL